MALFVAQVVSGLATGAVYALVALALVVVYRATRHVNFAVGEVGTFCAFLAWALLGRGLPYAVSVGLALLAAFVLGAFLHRALVSRVDATAPLNAVLVNIGLLLIFNSLSGVLFGYSLRTVPSPFDGWPSALNVVTGHQMGVLSVVAVAVLGTFFLFERTRVGLAMRAAAEDATSSQLSGISTGTMFALGWGISSSLGTLAAVLLAPTVFLEPNMMMGALVYGLAGALLGGIDRPAAAVAGGLLLGVLDNLVGVYLVGDELKLSFALTVIVLVLLVRPSGLFGRPVSLRV